MKKAALLIVISLLMVSCIAAFLTLANKVYEIDYYTNGEKTVAFIPMIHFNTPAFYQKVNKDMDSLRKAGYRVFYEGLDISPDIDSVAKMTILKKFRKATGVVFVKIDSSNAHPFHNIKLTNQSTTNIGINEKLDLLTDMKIDSLIGLYERDKGKIILSDCDLKTDLKDKYKCGKARKSARELLILNYRNQYLADKIIKSKSDKILVVYGMSHEDGVMKNLKKADHSWKAIDQKGNPSLSSTKAL